MNRGCKKEDLRFVWFSSLNIGRNGMDFRKFWKPFAVDFIKNTFVPFN